MKKYLKSVSYLFLSLTLLLGACEVEETLEITSPDPALILNTPGISNVFLNFSLPDNPAFTISWNDQLSEGENYSVEMSTNAEFSTPINIGSTTRSNFSMSVTEFNEAINNAGVTTFRDVAVYLRVNSSNATSNSVLLLVTTYPVNAPEITGVSNGDAFVLSLDNNDNTAVTFGWDDAILQSTLNIDVQYILEGATAGTSFAAPIEAGNVTNEDAISLTHSQLNRMAIESGIAVDASGDLDMRVRALITDTNTGEVLERISSTVTINVTTYLTVLDLSSAWGVVGSAANNWGATPDLPFYQTGVDGVFAAYVNLTDGEIKFRENNDWGVNYGDNGADGSIELNGANIAVTAGSYKIILDFNTNSYTIENFSLGIVGGAYNNWGATPDFKLEYDQYSDVFRGIVTVIDGEMKFRMNNDWGTNWGDNGNDGTLDRDGANIYVDAGIYIATVNLNDFTYTLEKIDYVWGLVGGAYNNWGATADAQFTRDWSRPFNDIWILEDVTLIDGEYKFRANNDWGVNYGDNGGDGTLDRDGANLSTAAGTYTFTLDFSDPDNITYTKQ